MRREGSFGLAGNFEWPRMPLESAEEKYIRMPRNTLNGYVSCELVNLAVASTAMAAAAAVAQKLPTNIHNIIQARPLFGLPFALMNVPMPSNFGVVVAAAVVGQMELAQKWSIVTGHE